MKIYKTQIFDKWIKKKGITDKSLKDAIVEICDGLIDADMGNGLIKKRMSKPGHGKRGSYRTLLAFKSNSRAIFLTGFSKSDKDNISPSEKTVFKKLCVIYLNMNNNEIESMCNSKRLNEVIYEKK